MPDLQAGLAYALLLLLLLLANAYKKVNLTCCDILAQDLI
jgi:hypothetical protein